MICALVFSLAVVPASAAQNPYNMFMDKIDSIGNLQGDNAFAVQDVTGDSIPELIYVTKSKYIIDAKTRLPNSTVHVLQYRNGELVEILSQAADFGPHERGTNIFEIFGSRDALVICTGYGDAKIKEFPKNRDYTWYRYSGGILKRGETLANLQDPYGETGTPGGNQDGNHFYYGVVIDYAGAEITEAQYASYLSRLGAYGEPLISMKGMNGQIVATSYDRGLNAMQAKTRFNDYLIKFTGFLDVPNNSWFAKPVIYVADQGLMRGTSPYIFSPNMKVTRGQAVTILHRLAGTPSVSGTGGSFKDVSSADWYGKAVKWAAKNKIVSGYGNGYFGPNDPLNREQLATILYRYALFQKYPAYPTGSVSTFSDGKSISGYAKDAMKWAVGAGLISGMDDGRLAPAGTATRAQFATILQRFANLGY